MFGVECLEQCPAGTILNNDGICEGCLTGCHLCDSENPSICLKCETGFLAYTDQCVGSCPTGSIMSFHGDSCILLSTIDARLVYFPFIVTLAMAATVSWLGHKVKKSHRALTNFVIFSGLLQASALTTQCILTLVYGTLSQTLVIASILCLHVLLQLIVNCVWHRSTIRNDTTYAEYKTDAENKLSTMLRDKLAYCSWKSHKLLYSHFFGAKINTLWLKDRFKVQKLMLWSTICSVSMINLPLLSFNIYLLLNTNWGT